MKKDDCSGFTLIELILALTLLVIVLAVGYSSLTAIMRGSSLLNDERDSMAITNAILSRLTRELQLTYLDPRSALLPPQEGEQSGQPANAVLFGQSHDMNTDARGDRILFLAFEGGQYMPDGGTHSGVVQIGYRVEEDPEDKDMRSGQKRYVLVRDETPLIQPPEEAREKTMTFPITNRLSFLEFNYYDRDEKKWKDDWGKEKPRVLPAIIRFRLGIISPLGVEHIIETSVPLPSEG